MRGTGHQLSRMFSYISTEQRVSNHHPLHTIRLMVDGVWRQLGPRFDSIHAKNGRPSIPPEKLSCAAPHSLEPAEDLHHPYTLSRLVA